MTAADETRLKRIWDEPPIYALGEAVEFPDLLGEPFDDLVCVGGDLAPARVKAAYKSGIFPWFADAGLLHWFSPKIRMILDPARFRVSGSLRKTLRNGGFEVRWDSDFAGVMHGCALPRKHERTTWIADRFLAGYGALHSLGVAHSIEAWHNGALAGGLYGLLIGRAFFGESMFALRRDASKVALYALCQTPALHFIDCQVPSDHLASLGGETITRENYLARLARAVA